MQRVGIFFFLGCVWGGVALLELVVQTIGLGAPDVHDLVKTAVYALLSIAGFLAHICTRLGGVTVDDAPPSTMSSESVQP